MNNSRNIVAIMQPTYLPWSGYFNLIKESSVFVFLDDVQFERRSWQHRNRVIVNGLEHLLSVPVLKSGQTTTIAESMVDDSSHWRVKHLSTLTRSYNKHPHGKEAIECFENSVMKASGLLCELNTQFIKAVIARLGLDAEIHFSSSIKTSGAKSARLIEIVEHFGGDLYLSPRGSQTYIEEEGLFDQAGIPVKYQDFTPRPYPQKGTDQFIPFMSIFDLIANVGFREAGHYL